MQQFDTILPEDFDGVFRFTNATDEDFLGKWGGKEYLYPSQKTTPMVIVDATPLEVQNIRKKFARELAEREFFKSKEGRRLEATEKNSDGSPRFNSIHMAATYDESHLKPYIQQCLTPLPTAKAMIQDAPHENMEDRLSRTPKGKLRTRVLEGDESLVEIAKGAKDE